MGRPIAYAHEYRVTGYVPSLANESFDETRWADKPKEAERFVIRAIKEKARKERNLESVYVVIDSCTQLR